MTKKVSILIIVVLLIGLVVGCGGKDVAKQENGATETVIKVVDQAGREVVLNNEVKRIVTAYKPATQLVFALGAQDKLVGVNDGTFADKFFLGVYEDLQNNAKEIGSKKNGLNIETLVALKPDLVIMYSTKDSGEVVNKLKEQNIESIVIEPESLDKLMVSIEILGKALGEEDKASQLISYYTEKLDLINNRTKDVTNKKNVYLAGANGILSTCSADFYQHYMIEAAGGNDVAKELKGGWNTISAEQLIAWNPDVMVAVQYCFEGMPEVIQQNSQLQTINAVKSNELYRVPSNIGPWDLPEPRSILGILWLSKTLYPEKFSDIDLLKEVNEFHSEFYGKSFTELGGQLDERGIEKK